MFNKPGGNSSSSVSFGTNQQPSSSPFSAFGNATTGGGMAQLQPNRSVSMGNAPVFGNNAGAGAAPANNLKVKKKRKGRRKKR